MKGTIRATVKVAGFQRERRFVVGTPARVIKAWKADVRAKLSKRHPQPEYDALRDKLNALTGAAKETGDALWIALTQRTGKNDTATAARLIQEINDLLDAQKTKQAELAAAAGVASEAQVAANQKALDAITAMDDQLKSLFESVKNEAPEKVMGHVEAATRARIKAIETERNVAQQAIDETVGAAAAAAKEAREIIDRALAEQQFHIRVKVDLEGLPGTGTLTPSGSSGSQSSGSGGGAGTRVIQTVVYLDRKVLVEAMAQEVLA